MSNDIFSAAFRNVDRDLWLDDLMVISVPTRGNSFEALAGISAEGGRTNVGKAGLDGRM